MQLTQEVSGKKYVSFVQHSGIKVIITKKTEKLRYILTFPPGPSLSGRNTVKPG